DFDGPLDLLLTLIGKAQIDIRDIFVSEITDQYLEIVGNASDLDMEEASDFLVMAATLLEIKSRAMLPKPPEPEGEEDPETELIRRLEEYKRIRESVGRMKDFEDAAKRVFTKLPEEYPLPPQEFELTGLTMEGLMAALARILERRSALDDDPETNHYAPRNIHRDSFTVQECMLDLLQRLKKKRRMAFEEAFSTSPTKEEVVTYFLAILELLKLGRMHLIQTETYGSIELIDGKASPKAEDEPEEDPRTKRARKRKKEIPEAEEQNSRTEEQPAVPAEEGE
ncbi:MAG: segregation/condensation protein A, partial [Clostridia bacterium]|nr:segregation/condensation protein A [Clostridia bacterium]